MSTLWTTSRAAHNVVSSGPVTVTSINCGNNLADKNGEHNITIKNEVTEAEDFSIKKEVRCDESIDDVSDSEGELSHIDFSDVTMRSKKAKFNVNGEQIAEKSRPMSWEGELSDTEMKQEDENEEMKEIIIENGSINSTTIGTNYKTEPVKFTSDVKMIARNNTTKNIMHHKTEIPLVDKLSVNCYTNSPTMSHRNGKLHQIPPTPSPDSAIHSNYSPTQSPVTSRHLPSSGFSSPFTPSLSRNNSDASQYGGSQHSSCYSQSYSSVSVSPTQFSPTHSPVQSRHGYKSSVDYTVHEEPNNTFNDRVPPFNAEISHSTTTLNTSSGISRQQLINSPCPICGDKISGFHYGIFSCESCKGFFKRTVQNHKNYSCVRGLTCVVSIATRKKCPACRFDKCLNMGMKLEAIRVDRTRGGRSTYPFSYTLPAGITQVQNSNSNEASSINLTQNFKQEIPADLSPSPPKLSNSAIPTLLQQMMEVEHLWQCNGSGTSSARSTTASSNPNVGDIVTNLCNIADDRLYKIVKWCKSLPLFKNISIDDQIALLINAWCELLMFSCCYRSISTPGEIRVSSGKSISINQARDLGLTPCIERMLNFTENLRRLRVDRYEYVAMKVIVLLSSDSNLRDPDMVRASQEKALQALQEYTVGHYPDIPSKFGELLLRIPDLQRTSQVGKEMLSNKKEGEGTSFNLLMELLGGDH